MFLGKFDQTESCIANAGR